MATRMTAIELLLDDFRERCKELQAILLGMPSNSQVDEIRKELDQLNSRLKIAEKEVNSRGAFMEMTRANAVYKNRQERYVGLQSISSVQGNLRRISYKAADVRQKLSDLLGMMGVTHPLTAIGSAARKKVEKITEAEAKGDRYRPDGVDAAGQIGGTLVILTALASLVINALRSRAKTREDQTQG